MTEETLKPAQRKNLDDLLRRIVYDACQQFTGLEDIKCLSFKFEEDLQTGKIICRVEGPVDVMRRICFNYRPVARDADVTVTVVKE